MTIGKGHATMGFNWLHAHYNSLGGLDLSNGDYRPVIASNTPSPIQYSALFLDIDSDTYVMFASYGVTEGLEIGIVVPWISVSIATDLSYFGVGNVDITPGGHFLTMRRTTESGVGDIGLSGKYRLWREGDGGLAAEFEVRLPSGDKDNLRGTGVTRTLVSAIWSRGGRGSPHANFGYEFWSDSVSLADVSVQNQIVYGVGLEFQAHPRAAVLVDVLGRRQLGGGQLEYRTVPFPLGGTLDVLVPTQEDLDIVSVAPGVKWNVTGNVLLTGNVLASIADKGLRANIVPVVGFEIAF